MSATRIVLLRGINLGSTNRIAMPALREALAGAGFTDVRTHLQSGNVVLNGKASARRVHELIAERFDLDIAVVTRTRNELAEVVAANPFEAAGCPPKLYQVSFLDRAADAGLLDGFRALATGGERVQAIGREWYAIFPNGIARSKLAAAMAQRKLPVTATARNWTTVTKLLEMADDA